MCHHITLLHVINNIQIKIELDLKQARDIVRRPNEHDNMYIRINKYRYRRIFSICDSRPI